MTVHLECDNDQTLVMTLGTARRDTVHHRGNEQVAKALRREGKARGRPRNFYLPNPSKELHLIGKKLRGRFRDFIAALRQAEAPGIVQLSAWLGSS